MPLEGIRVVKSFSNESIEQNKFDEGNHQFLKTKEDSYSIMGKFFSGNQFFQGILYLSVLVLGGIFLSQGKITASDLVAYILFINVFLNPIDKLVNFTESFQRGMSGFERFLEIINMRPEIIDRYRRTGHPFRAHQKRRSLRITSFRHTDLTSFLAFLAFVLIGHCLLY